MKNAFNIGDEIKIEVHHKGVPGIKDLKPGNYVVTRYRESFSSRGNMVYDFKSVRKNSTYVYTFFQDWIESNATLVAK